MIRILLLRQAEADFQTHRSIEALGRLGQEFDLHCSTIGAGGTYRNGIDALRQLRRQHYDVIHAWGSAPLTCAAMASRAPLLVSPAPQLGRRGLRWLNAVASYRSVHIACASATQQYAAMASGLTPSHCHLVRPGVDFARVSQRRDSNLRRALGLRPAGLRPAGLRPAGLQPAGSQGEDFVFIAPGESTSAAAHERALWSVAILHVLDPRYKLLAWGRGPRTAALRRLADRLHQPQLLCLATDRLGPDVEFEQILPAADAALITATAPVTPLPYCITMAAGLPIVSTPSRTIAELLEDRHTALMVSRDAPRLIAQRILDLQADPQLCWSIADRARTEAYDYFSLTRFLDDFRALYRQLAAKPARPSYPLAHV